MAFELDLTYPYTATLYAIIRKVSDGTVWNGTAFVAFVNGDIANYDVPLTNQGGDYYAATMPAGIAAGSYRIQYYEPAGGTPATTDELLATEEFYWSGTVVVSPPPEAYTGRYTTLDEITTFLDSLNYTVHTDSDRDGNSDLAAAVQGHRSGEARVDFYTRGPHTFAETDAGTSVASLFNQWAYKLASVEYASKRGFSSQDQENEFLRVEQRAIDEMKAFALDPYGVVEPDEEEASDDVGDFQNVAMSWTPIAATDEDSA